METFVGLMSHETKQYLCRDPNWGVIVQADKDNIASWEVWQLQKSGNNLRVRNNDSNQWLKSSVGGRASTTTNPNDPEALCYGS
jgi:hypothetical protein